MEASWKSLERWGGWQVGIDIDIIEEEKTHGDISEDRHDN